MSMCKNINNKLFLFVVSLLCFSTGVNAAIISVDWQSSGDNLITQDTASGLEWLDLTTTSNRSYLDVSSSMGVGQEFYGWRYATSVEVGSLYDAFGGDSNYYYTGWSSQNVGLFGNVASSWGDLYCSFKGCPNGDGYSYFMVQPTDSVSAETVVTGEIGKNRTFIGTYQEWVRLDASIVSVGQRQPILGSALVRTSVVPVPAAIWLFFTGLIGLFGAAKYKVKNKIRE